MTKTENFQLPQWEAGDPVRREDFNGAMAAIDAGLAGTKEGLDGLAETAFTPDNLPYVLGSITVPTGDETNIVLETFPFKPSAILFMNGVSVSVYNRKLMFCKVVFNDVSEFSTDVRYIMTVWVSGTKLILDSRNTTYGGIVYYMAFR